MKIQYIFSKLYTAGTTNVVLRTGCSGYLSKNSSATLGVVVLQEWWGLNQSIIDTTNKVADKGFLCLTPDLFRGKVAKNQEDAGHLLEGLDWNQAVIDVDSAAQHLKGLGCTKVGVLGFCMGGALSIAAITSSKHIHAAVPFYGVCDLTKFQLGLANGPIYGQFGDQDTMKGFSSPDDAKRLLNTGKKAGMDVKVKFWKGVGHAFMNQDRETYNKQIAEEALEEASKFLKNALMK